ncbi:putative reverse transcriptase domain, ribonuclease H-like domain, aspartic peptidase domain protein [Tanacetum coccineum]
MKSFPSDMSLGIVAGDCMVFADKSWLEKPRGSREFYDGVQKFVAHCTPLVNSAGKIRCPCKRCRNILFKPIEWIGDHITDNGWDPLYTVWDKHGEPALPTPPPLMSDMTALLDDLSYIPPNNEHNEPTQGDIGETSNEPTQATRNEFEELYSSANEALYPGCDHVTRLDFMAKFTYFKVKGKLTDSIFNEMLEWLQYALPESKGYKFPPSYYAIKKTFKTIGLGYESIHACEHDCCLFRGEVKQRFCNSVPVCNTSRMEKHDTYTGNKVPRKSDVNKLAGDIDNINLPPWLSMKERPPMSVKRFACDGVRYVVQSRDERRTTQNSGICAPGLDGEMSYGQLQEILDFKYLSFKVALFRMADVARAHGGETSGEDPSTSTSYIMSVLREFFIKPRNRKRKPNLGGVKAGRKTRERTRNQQLKDAVAANKGRPIEIGFSEDRR